MAVITLNRPITLNAFSHDMVRQLATLLGQRHHDDNIVALVLHGTGQKGFHAGGSVRTLYQLVQRGRMKGDDGWLQFFVDEYRLDYTLHQFPKPIAALMDGVTMGGGISPGQAARLRAVTERTKMIVPETRIGFLPDVGVTHFLSVVSPELELYAGLTSMTLTGVDVLHCHPVDIYAPIRQLASFEDRLQRIPRDGDLVRAPHHVFKPSYNIIPCASLVQATSWVRCYFDCRSPVDHIVATLCEDLGREQVRKLRQWLQATPDVMTMHSPIMLHVTHEALLYDRQLPLTEYFQMELGITARGIQEDDSCEGVYTHPAGRDHRSGWASATPLQVWPERVRYLLTSSWRMERHSLVRFH